MTMTAFEEKTLRQFVEQPHASGTLYAVVAALASVALKAESIKRATAAQPVKDKSDGE